jgi:phosphoribosylanthranilate isomerase
MPQSMVLKIAEECGLYAIQLHGLERPEEYRDIGLPLWRAVCLHDRGPTPKPQVWNAQRYLIDVKKAGACRGTGLTADWDRAAEFALKWPAMLAGGLNEGNIAAAIRKVHPLGVDVSSGIERKPGKKDYQKMKAFIRQAKLAFID